MYENDNNYDVEVEDVMEDMDGMGHPVLTVIASLIGGAAIGTGGTLLVKKLMNKDNKEKQLKRKQKKFEKLKKDAEKLGIDLSSLPEVEIPEDEELDGEIEKFKKDVEKLGIDLSSLPEIEIPEDEELDGEIETETGNVKVEVKANSKKNKKKGE